MTDNMRYDASYKVAWRVFQSRKGREKLRKVANDRSKFIDKMDGLLTAAYRMEKSSLTRKSVKRQDTSCFPS